MAFEIKPLLEADTLNLVKVHYRAFDKAAGRHFFTSPPSEESYVFMAAQRAKVIAKPNIKAYQAVDPSNGDLIGAAIFSIDPEGTSKEKLDNPEPIMTEYVPEQNAALWRDFGKVMRDGYARIVGTRPAVEVLMLLVAPEWQGKGVGSALLDMGVKEADRYASCVV
jgi:ribosomal protein S18 acetylase RimI-like enzyme